MKKSQSITAKVAPFISIALLILIWAGVTGFFDIKSYVLPSPVQVFKAFISDFDIMMQHTGTTLTESIAGLAIGIVLAFIMAALMDRFKFLYDALYPILVITQTIPTVAIAPILIMWMGFGMSPKITIVVITTFFPIAVGLLDGYKSVDPDAISLVRSMGAGNMTIFRQIKMPAALPQFFSGLKISASYAIVGAVVAEWVGGTQGLGVYMTRMRKAYSFDKMFAVIILIVIISLILMLIVNLARYLLMPYERKQKQN